MYHIGPPDKDAEPVTRRTMSPQIRSLVMGKTAQSVLHAAVWTWSNSLKSTLAVTVGTVSPAVLESESSQLKGPACLRIRPENLRFQ